MQNRQTVIESLMCLNYIVPPDSIHENDDRRKKPTTTQTVTHSEH